MLEQPYTTIDRSNITRFLQSQINALFNNFDQTPQTYIDQTNEILDKIIDLENNIEWEDELNYKIKLLKESMKTYVSYYYPDQDNDAHEIMITINHLLQIIGEPK